MILVVRDHINSSQKLTMTLIKLVFGPQGAHGHNKF